MDVGFVGLGDQGGPMAEAIIRGGHRLHVWARRREALEPFVQQGAVAQPTPEALAAAVDHLGICVVAESDVHELLHARGMFAAMRAGSIVAIHTTMAPQACRDLAADGAARSIAVLDAPVSGGREAALASRLLLMAGGDEIDVRAALPVFSCYASRIRHVGAIGTAQTVKILNNLLLNANLAASHFVLEFGQALDIDRTLLREVLLAGTGASVALDWLDRTIVPGNHAAILGRKDIALALGLSGEIPEQIGVIGAFALAGREALAGLQ